MKNKQKRLYVKLIPLMFLAVIGANAIEAIVAELMMNTYVSLNWMSQNANITINMPKAMNELGTWTLLSAIWLIVIHLVMIWYVSEKLDGRLARKWPDEPALKVRLTKKKSI